MPPGLRVLFFALVFLLALGCGGPTPLPADTPTSLPPTNTIAPTHSPTSEVNMAYDFTFTLFQGEDELGRRDLNLSQLRGTPIVLNFWARFCGPCWHEMPELQEFYEEFQGRVSLLGIDIGQFTGLGSPRDATKLLEALGITYPAGFTDDGKVVQEYRVKAMPTTVFIGGDGEIFESWTGALDRSTVTRLAKAMLDRESRR